VGGGGGELMTQLEREGHRVASADAERAGDLPFDDGSFDTVLLGDFLAGWASRERPFAEAWRVLRPGGRLIVAVPYAAGPGGDRVGTSLHELLGELAEFSVAEVATVDDGLCVLAERKRARSAATAWRQGLAVAEERLAARERAAAVLSGAVVELEASREREERALADARGDVERLETALAAAAHRRDLEEERARLATDGVAALEQRLRRLRADRDRDRVEAEHELERRATAARRELVEAQARLERSRAAALDVQRELDAAGTLLEARDRHLKTAQLGVEARDRKLEVADRALGARDAELARLRAAASERERKLALAEARLEKAQQRAEAFRGSLVAIREGRAYRLMRILWRLRRPFRRVPRDTAPAKPPAAEDADPVPPAPAAPPPLSAAPSPVAIAEREPRPERGERLRVASILDEMSAACFAPECDLVPLSLEGWHEQLEGWRPDLLLVESAWNGNGGEWQYRLAQYPRKDLVGLPALRALLGGCRERGIPTAFWNKEDPVHFERFSEAASLFDHVFTTDARCVERYRALPGERTVAPLPFAAQPRIHNPVATVAERSASPCFAGAWYRDRHPDRRRSLEALLDAARPHGLVIYDRRLGAGDAAFGFPERFAPHVVGKLPYGRILDVYKSHRVFLNANSVADSPTMCSRRVFELAACDTAIVSTPGAALSALLGEDMVEEASEEEAAAAALERLLGDERERARRTRAARRTVLTEHTYAERLATIAETAGLDASSLRRKPFALPGASADGAGAAPNGSGNGHPWLLALQPGITLSAPALADLAAAATFADADVIGVGPARPGDSAIEHRHVAELDPRALLLRRKLVESRGRPVGSVEQVRSQLLSWGEDGVSLYAADADLLPAKESRPMAGGPR
jgi:SAM-dependent methyltransferase